MRSPNLFLYGRPTYCSWMRKFWPTHMQKICRWERDLSSSGSSIHYYSIFLFIQTRITTVFVSASTMATSTTTNNTPLPLYIFMCNHTGGSLPTRSEVWLPPWLGCEWLPWVALHHAAFLSHPDAQSECWRRNGPTYLLFLLPTLLFHAGFVMIRHSLKGLTAEASRYHITDWYFYSVSMSHH